MKDTTPLLVFCAVNYKAMDEQTIHEQWVQGGHD